MHFEAAVSLFDSGQISLGPGFEGHIRTSLFSGSSPSSVQSLAACLVKHPGSVPACEVQSLIGNCQALTRYSLYMPDHLAIIECQRP